MAEELSLDRLAEKVAQDHRRLYWDKRTSADLDSAPGTPDCRIDYQSLLKAIERYNTEISQGFAIGTKIEFDFTLLRLVIEHYNNLINNKHSIF